MVLLRIGVNLPFLIAVGRGLLLWVVCSRSEQREGHNPVSIFARFGEASNSSVGTCNPHMCTFQTVLGESSTPPSPKERPRRSTRRRSESRTWSNRHCFRLSSYPSYRTIFKPRHPAVGASSTYPFGKTATGADTAQGFLPYDAVHLPFHVLCPSLQHKLMLFRRHLDA